MNIIFSSVLACVLATATVVAMPLPTDNPNTVAPLIERLFQAMTVGDDTKVTFENDSKDLEKQLRSHLPEGSKDKDLTWGDIKSTKGHWDSLSASLKPKLIALLRRISDSGLKKKSVSQILGEMAKAESEKSANTMISVPKRLAEEWSKNAKSDEEKLFWKQEKVSADRFFKKMEEDTAKPSVPELTDILGSLVKEAPGFASNLDPKLDLPETAGDPGRDFLSTLPRTEGGSDVISSPTPTDPIVENMIQRRIQNMTSNFKNVPKRSPVPQASYDYGHQGLIGGQKMPSGKMNLSPISGPTPGYMKARSLSSSEIEEMREGFPGSKVSVEMYTTYNNDPSKRSKCQASPIMKRPSGNACHYTFATAQHCVTDAAGNITGIEMPGLFGHLVSPQEVVRNFNNPDVGQTASMLAAGATVVELNPDRLDVSLIHTIQPCNDQLPVFPPKPEGFVENEPIFVDTDRVHVAMPNGLGTNGSIGVEMKNGIIVPGNSGGGAVDKNGNWVGAVSTVYVGHPRHGFVASDYALEWVRQGVRPFEPQATVPHRDLASVEPTTHRKIGQGL